MNANNVSRNRIDATGQLELVARHLAPLPPARDAQRDNIPAAAGATAVTRLMAEEQARDTILVSRTLYTRYAPGLSSEDGRAITRSGMWSGMGFVGASVLAAGLLLLTNGGAGKLAALALVIGGGALATFAWRRAWHVLDRLDRSSAGNAGATGPVAGAGVDADGRFARRVASAHPRTALSAG